MSNTSAAPTHSQANHNCNWTQVEQELAQTIKDDKDKLGQERIDAKLLALAEKNTDLQHQVLLPCLLAIVSCAMLDT